MPGFVSSVVAAVLEALVTDPASSVYAVGADGAVGAVVSRVNDWLAAGAALPAASRTSSLMLLVPESVTPSQLMAVPVALSVILIQLAPLSTEP